MTRPPPPGNRRYGPTLPPTLSPRPSAAPDPRREAVRDFAERYGGPPGAVAAISPPGAETTAPAAERPAERPAG